MYFIYLFTDAVYKTIKILCYKKLRQNIILYYTKQIIFIFKIDYTQ